MSKIIQIGNLYDNYHKMDFGYRGIDIETKRIRYYSHYDLNQKYNVNSLYEFDPNNIEVDNHINWHMAHCKYKSNSSKKIPDELEQLVKSLIEQHKQYNISNNYPIEYIDQNKISLSIQYQSNFSLFSDSEFSATYTPVENIIGLTTVQSEWNNLSDDDKDSLIHEIGHTNASCYKRDQVNNVLIVKEGFYINDAKLNPIILENGDIFYMVINVPKKCDNYPGRALEEIEKGLVKIQ